MLLQSLFENLAAPLLGLWPHLVLAAATLALGFGVAAIGQKVILRMPGRATLETRLFAGRLIFAGLAIGAVLAALAASGVHIAALATLIGTLGLAISLSLQDLARNLVAGLYLLWERPFRLGDQITVRTFAGRVERINMRTTALRTDEDEQVLIPNTVMMSEVVLKRVDVKPLGNREV